VQGVIPDAIDEIDEKLSVNYIAVHTLKIAALEKRIAELEAKLK
jgi:polyhydroxyalkanoate synthesis regulator phasin